MHNVTNSQPSLLNCKNGTKYRDDTIDTLRGFAMMYVIFIHCLYWSGVFTSGYSSVLKSLFIIEMPLFFFIAGASNSLGKKRSVLSFYISRFQRVLLPYWIYGFICILLTIIAHKTMLIDRNLIFNDIDNLDPYGPAKFGELTEQTKYVIFDIPRVFLPVTNLPYLTGALWFIPVYLYVIMLFPLLKWYYEKYENDNKKYIPLIMLSVLLLNNGWKGVYNPKRMVIFYSFWIYAGLFFQKLKINESFKNKQKIIPVIIFCALLVLLFILINHRYADMQGNKFPPNIIFLIYTCGALSAFYLCSKYIINGINYLRRNRIFNWIYKQYIQNCYTVFLYHPLSFAVLYFVITYTGIKEYVFFNQWLCLFVYIVLTILMSAVLRKLFSWTEKIKIINR